MNLIRAISSFTQSSRLIVAGFVLVTIAAIVPNTVGAAPVTGFNAGRIIDDSIFTNANSMNAGQIQTFLNTKVPACETWHTPGYGQNPPFICLKDFSENGRSAAQIIYDTAQQYQINPQVLIVLLQKEQGLVTDTWPLNTQYRTATGYGCPDTAPCDSQYYGLTNQLNWSGKMFRAIMNASPTWYTPYVLGNNYVQWSPNSSCGGTTVNINNRATQALYNYTPYQPNQAALNAGYGTGDACSAYGNRNFYQYFKDWFGSTQVSEPYLNKSLGSNKLTPGTVIRGGDFITSPDGRFVTVMQFDGNLVTYSAAKAVWYTKTSGNYGAYASFQADGNLVVYSADGRALWNASTQGSGANQAILQDDGNIHIYAGSAEKYVTNFKVTPSATSNVGTQLSSGARLNGGSYIKSPDGRYSLVMQTDGNLALFTADATRLWHTNTPGNPGAYVVMQTDGNLVVYSSSNKALWNSGTSGKGASTLNLQSDGNLVIYTSGKATWHTNTWNNNYRMKILAGNQLTNGARLNTAEFIMSPDWRYRLVMQTDGNLVVYSVNRYHAIWSSGTYRNPGSYVVMQTDGNLVVYSASNKPLWSSATSGKGSSTLNLQSDGNLVIYNTNGASWASWTSGKF